MSLRQVFVRLRDLSRAAPWAMLAILTGFIAGGNEANAAVNHAVLAWKVTLITGGAFLGYWIDRSLFPGARPHEHEDAAEATRNSAVGDYKDLVHLERRADAARYRRAIIVAACILAAAMGV